MTEPQARQSRARAISQNPTDTGVAFSIATLVTDHAQYAAMQASMREHGFGDEACEFLFLDNSGANALSAYAGLNRLLDEARGRFIILCHQDIRLHSDDRATLEARLADLTAHDPHWAVAGNAGGVAPGRLATRISDPHGRDTAIGPFPARVASLDENFLVVRRGARLAFSNDLDGFHLYGADLCTLADIQGHSSWVIDFHLEHLSAGNKANGFSAAEYAFRSKYRRALRTRWIQTTCTLAPVSGQPIVHWLTGHAARPAAGIIRRVVELNSLFQSLMKRMMSIDSRLAGKTTARTDG